MQKEEFKEFPNEDYKKRYLVSKTGIYDTKTKNYTISKVTNGYNKINIYANTRYKMIRVDEVIASVFCLPKKEFLVHLDNNYLNDHADNLKWVDICEWLGEKHGFKWKKIEEYKYAYISETGLIWNSYIRDFISQRVHVGYMAVGLNSDFHHVHRLIAKYFCENSEEKKIVNHKDGNKLNNNSKNLEWCTTQENIVHAVQNLPRKDRITQYPVESPEKFVELKDFPDYRITKDGHVYSVFSSIYLTETINDNGYFRVVINKKPRYIHRLVAFAYLQLPTPLSNYQVNHKNLNKLDNRVENLEWITISENVKHSKHENSNQYKHLQKRVAKLNPITNEIIEEYDGIKIAGRKTNINSGSIVKACKEDGKLAGKFKWKYLKEN
jgi:hypothetical protein